MLIKSLKGMIKEVELIFISYLSTQFPCKTSFSLTNKKTSGSSSLYIDYKNKIFQRHVVSPDFCVLLSSYSLFSKCRKHVRLTCLIFSTNTVFIALVTNWVLTTDASTKHTQQHFRSTNLELSCWFVVYNEIAL